MSSSPASSMGITPALRALVWAACGIGCLVGLLDTGQQYAFFLIPQVGSSYVDPRELAFLLWYSAWGIAAIACLTIALAGTSVPGRCLELWARVAERPRLSAWCAAGFVLLCALLVRSQVLQYEPIADDEMTYTFEARTLAAGRVVNPAPQDPAFFANAFTFINERGWYGKYPIGHPAVLALGELVGLPDVMVPLLGLIGVLLAVAVGARLFGARAATLGALLLCISPQFVFTHATLLSQPTASVLMLALMLALLELDARQQLRYAVFAGVCCGALILVRPLPGALFIAAAVFGRLALALGSERRPALRRLLAEIGSAAPGLAAGVLLMAWINTQQSGSATVSGYHSSSAVGAALSMQFGNGMVSASLGGALLRQNYWLLGWVCSFAFIPFARSARGSLLFWGMIVAELGYRVLQPKTVVATTGPIYVFEIVPLLCMASAAGALHVASGLADLGWPRAREWVATSMLAATAVAFVGFLPVQVGAMTRGVAARLRIHTLLAERGGSQALVFTNQLVAHERQASWAYTPPNPRPDFSDHVLFVRRPEGPGGPLLAHRFWRRRFPERRAFLFADSRTGTMFVELQPDQRPSPRADIGDLLQEAPHVNDATAAGPP